MRAFMAASLPQNPWLLGAFMAVLALFVAVIAVSIWPSRSRELERTSRLPLND